MKKTLCFVMLIVLLTATVPLTASAATATMTASVSATTVTVGQTVTVTAQYNGGGAKIGSLDAQFHYNASTFQYVSCSGADAAGGAGLVRLSWLADGATAPTSVTVKLTFKAIAAGAGDFSLETTELINDDDYSSLGTPKKSFSVSAGNPTLSGNANLKSLKPSSGTLTPAFKASVTSYVISIPFSTSSLSLSVTTADKGAKTTVSGTNALKVGKNTQTITVTAPNGTTKRYTVVINRAGANDTADKTDGNNTAASVEDQLEVEVGGALMKVRDTQPEAELPEGFVWGVTNINGMAVSAARRESDGMVLVFLIPKEAENTDAAGHFYLYHETEGTFEKFCPLTVKETTYILLDVPSDMANPTGTVAADFVFEGEAGEHRVFAYEDTAQEDFIVVYAAPVNGEPRLYVYDKAEGTMQRYRETAIPAEVPVTPEPEETTPWWQPILHFIAGHRPLVLYTGAGVLTVGIVVIVIACSVSASRRRRENCKH